MSPIFVVASLWIREGCVAEFEAYERKASRIMKRYGGDVERAIRVEGGTAADRPFEIHLVTFPSQAMFDAYRTDAELNALSEERSAAITRSEVLVGAPVLAEGDGTGSRIDF